MIVGLSRNHVPDGMYRVRNIERVDRAACGDIQLYPDDSTGVESFLIYGVFWNLRYVNESPSEIEIQDSISARELQQKCNDLRATPPTAP